MKYLTIILLVLTGCRNSNNYYVKITDSKTNKQGYVNAKGDTVIALGNYAECFTDTFRNYAIVSKCGEGFIGIDRSERVLFHVYPFDNGPDYPSDGLFRIIENGKIGYADLQGNIVIKPQFGCAFPFESGHAKAALTCSTQMDGEYSVWNSDHWFYIGKFGARLRK
jgi:hypothetical protein